ncbi:hypothetical protein JR316_0009362 [Psilocybe cubensis]|uniref:Uncharacterized protein n=1 Tax=Psilocybe cubensis TaxID=181762 RepID=A0ACB8GT47_PSICU|nr:hypothetical protein JR316_0009362 [Psilocybe cubensis]KAH9478900.1 hypothetical protein JR316_0009362 [Psilocybe cubensis]
MFGWNIDGLSSERAPTGLEFILDLFKITIALSSLWKNRDCSHSQSSQILVPGFLSYLSRYASGLYVERSLFWCSRLVPPCNFTKPLPSPLQKQS